VIKKLLFILDDSGFLQPFCAFLADSQNSPLKAVQHVIEDLKKLKQYNNNFGEKVLIAGLPKSGTTLIESILRTNGYIDLNHTSVRRTRRIGLKYPGNQIANDHFSYCKNADFVFAKTHIVKCVNNIRIIKNQNLKLFVAIRDLRDVMVSRYFHIMQDKSHWQHSTLKNLPFKEGLMRSFFGTISHPEHPLVYFKKWVIDWLNYEPENIIPFEVYQENPLDYIYRITSGLKLSKEPQHILEKLISQDNKLRNKNFADRLKASGRLRSTFRNEGPKGWKNIFTNEIKNEFKKQAQEALIKSGYETNDNW
jgi:uncharacterized protein YutE (UPF0331/DUF86 family)